MNKNKNSWLKIPRLLIMTLLAAALVMASNGLVHAMTNQQIQDQRSTLEARIAANQKILEDLSKQANTLANKVAAYDAEIARLSSQIQLTETQLAQTRQQLDETRRQLEEQKAILRKSLREHYTFGDVRTIELLAESDSFSDFFDQQEYLTRVRSSIQDSAKKVAELEKQLAAQEKQQADLLTQLNGQKTEQASKRQEQARLLAQTRGQESLYQQKVRSDQAESQRLQNLLAARQKVIGGGTGGYPYANSCGEPYPPPETAGYCPDHWTYYDRQCTSWAYWRRINMGREAEMNWHNAGDWKDNAQADGYAVGQTPKVGAIGVISEGSIGHVYIVEDIQDGTVIASQYNSYAANGAWGRYSLVSKSPSQYAGDWFIY